MINIKFVGVMLILLTSIGFVVAVQSGNPYTYNIQNPTTFNNNTAFVNASAHWITNSLGALDDANTAQFDNIGGTLTMDEAWLNFRFCQLIGCTMQGNMNMNMNNITNINELQAPDGSAIKFGDGIFDGIDQAINIQTNQSVMAGVVTHVLTDVQGNRIIEAWQSGKNNSWGFHRNSYGIFGDLGITNASLLTNALYMWENISVDPLLHYDTTNQGASLGVQYGIETQKLFIHDDAGNGQVLVEGLFRVVARDGDDIDLYEAPVHILDLSIKEFGFAQGVNLTLITENFESGSLGIFTLITSGKGIDEWAEDAGADCPPNGAFCAGAGPTGGSGATIMQTNFSTIELQDMSLNFTINTDGMTFGGDFEVTVNNNVGSGDVSIYSLTGADEVDATITAALPASMENESIVTMEFSFLSTNPVQGFTWVDQIAVNATTSSSTLVNVTVAEGEIEFGSGECKIEQDIISSEGETQMNITCDNINLVGNVTQSSVTEIELNVTTNVTANNFIARQNFYLDGVKINDTFLRIDGKSTMAGNLDMGGNNITNVGEINVSGMLYANATTTILGTTDEPYWYTRLVDEAGGLVQGLEFVPVGGGSTLDFGSIANRLYIRGVAKNPGLIFTDEAFTNVVSIIPNISTGITTFVGGGKTIWNDNDFNLSGNMTADYYFGDGSQLTNLPSGGNASWNESHANSLYVNVDGDTMTGDLMVDTNIYADRINGSTKYGSATDYFTVGRAIINSPFLIVPEIEFVGSGTFSGMLGSIKDTLYIRGVTNNPQFILSDETAGTTGIFLLNKTDGIMTFTGTSGTIWTDDFFNVSSNVSASYYFGDGSQLTNLPDGGNASWNESHANSLYVNVDGDTMTGNLTVNEYVLINKKLTIRGDTTKQIQASNRDTPFNVSGIGLDLGVYHQPEFISGNFYKGINGINVIGGDNYTTGSELIALNFISYALGNGYQGLGDAGNSTLTAIGIFVQAANGLKFWQSPFDGLLTVGNVTGLDLYSAVGSARVHGDITGAMLRASTTTETVDGNETVLRVELPTKGSSNFQVVLEGANGGSGIWFDGQDGNRMYSDGTNFVFDSGSGLSWFTGDVSANDLIDRTVFWNESMGSALEYSYDTTNLTSDEEIPEFERVTYQVVDMNRPEIKYWNTSLCWKDVPDYQNIPYFDCIVTTHNETIYPYTKNETGRLISASVGRLTQAQFEISENIKLEDNLTTFTTSTLAEHYITNTTKDPATLTKVENFYNSLANKTYQEMKDMVLTPEGKLNDKILFDYEQSSIGSYNLEAIGHTNRAMNVLMLWKIAANEKRLDDIEETLCNQGALKYC